MLRCDEAGKDRNASGLDREVVKSTAKLDAAHLLNAQPATLSTVIERQLLQPDHAVGNAMELKIILMGRQVIEQQHRTPPASKEMLQCENLAAISKRTLGQKPHLG